MFRRKARVGVILYLAMLKINFISKTTHWNFIFLNIGVYNKAIHKIFQFDAKWWKFLIFRFFYVMVPLDEFLE